MTKISENDILNSQLDSYMEEMKKGFDEVVMDLYFKERIDLLDLTRIKTDNYGDAGADYIFFNINRKQFFEIADLRDYKSDNIIDVFFIQTKSSKKIESKVPNNFLELSTSIIISKEQRNHYNSEIKANIDLINKIIKKYGLKNDIHFHFYYFGRFSEKSIESGTDLKGRFDTLKLFFDDYKQIIKNVYINIISIDNIIENIKNDKNFEFQFTNVDVFKSYMNNTGHYGLISLIPLKDFYKFITDNEGNINEKIFESNIRDFKGSSSVNNKIMASLNDNNSLDFWWLNNGITITVEELKEANPIREINVKNPQIINGLQTSYSIYNYYSNNLDQLENEDRKVFVKILQFTDALENKEIDVIISTNSQNEIRDKDIHANDNVQKNIEMHLLSKGKYYQRKDKYYSNRKYPNKDIIRLNDLAKYINTIYLKDPSSTRNNPGKLLKGSKYQEVFKIKDPNQDYNRYIIASEIYSKIFEFNKGKIVINEDEFDKANFIHHIVYIVIIILNNKLDYNPDALLKMDISIIDKNKIDEAYKILIEIINNNKIPNSKILKSIKEIKFNKMINEYMLTYLNDVIYYEEFQINYEKGDEEEVIIKSAV